MIALAQNLTIAYLLDLIFGDPQWFPHPVRFIGFLIDRGEDLLRKWVSREILAGTILTFSLIFFSFLSTCFLLKTISAHSPTLSRALEIFLLYCCLSTKDLTVECSWVKKALKSGNIFLARKKLSWVVGRDTEQLDEKGIIRATVETVAENTVDGIISPLFYAVIGGAPLALTYKTINTLDSMIGHKDKRYIQFGKIAAYIDQWANWVPARLSGFIFPIAAGLLGFSVKDSYMAAWGQGAKSSNQNSAIPEAAMAGALQVQLGGLNFYKGQPVSTPCLGNPNRSLSLECIGESLKIMYAASALCFLICVGVRLLIGIIF